MGLSYHTFNRHFAFEGLCLSSTALVVNFLLNSVTKEESCRFIIISCVSGDIYLVC